MKSWLRAIGLILVGLAIGVGLGLYLGWEAWPTEFTDAHPGALADRYRRDYAIMIATNYALDNDLEMARQQVNTLSDNGRDYFLSMTLDTILRGENETDIRYLVRLSSDLGLYSPAMEPYLDTVSTPTPEASNGE